MELCKISEYEIEKIAAWNDCRFSTGQQLTFSPYTRSRSRVGERGEILGWVRHTAGAGAFILRIMAFRDV